MSQLPNVVIIMSRCGHSRETFGIRLEEQGYDIWVADWAFPVRENIARKEGYDQTKIKGSFDLDEEYPGCPYCKGTSFMLCFQCDKVSCYDGHSASARCGWCGLTFPVGGRIGELKAGGDL